MGILLHGRWKINKPHTFHGKRFAVTSIVDTRTGQMHGRSTRTMDLDEAWTISVQIAEELHALAIGAVVPGITVEQALGIYVKRFNACREVTKNSVTWRLRNMFKLIGLEKLMTDISFATMENWWNSISTKAPRTRIIELSLQRAFWKWAIRRQFVMKSPVEGLAFPKVRSLSGKAYTFKEAQEIVKQNDFLRLPILIALHAGLRRGTIKRLRWCNIDLVNRRFNLPADIMKGGEAAVLPIHEEIVQALRAEFLRNPSLNPRHHVWGKTLQDIPCGVHWHDLRRTFASLHAARVPHAVLQALMAHRPLDVTDIYARIPFETLKAAVDAQPWFMPRPRAAEGGIA